MLEWARPKCLGWLVMNYEVMVLKTMKDERGKLIALEGWRDLPFEIKRVYYIFDTRPDMPRGGHAHMNLEQMLVCMDGSCEILLDDGKSRESVILNRPDIGLYIGRSMWREMKNFSYGCKLMILASDFYDENEYIRNYNEFLKSLK